MQRRTSIIGVLIAALQVGASLAPLGHVRTSARVPRGCADTHAESPSAHTHTAAVAARGCAPSACFHDDATCPLCLALATGGLAALPAAHQRFPTLPGESGLSADRRHTDRSDTVGYGAHRARAPPTCL
jgi:hypothetical protein